MKAAALFFAAVVASLPAAAQSGRYIAPPPIVLSPNLTDPWVMQLQPGSVPIYAAPVVSAPAARTPTTWAPPTATANAVPQARRVDPRSTPLAPEFLPQVVNYDGKEAPGTILIDTNNRFLYLVESKGIARRYGVGVGRPGFSWAGAHKITRKAEWPDWYPPSEMRQRQPNLPQMMPGGPKNPLGARAMYLGSTLYRIHGTAEPWTIGHAVSSGCIRMRNEDVTDLYSRVKVGARVIVI